MTLYYNPLFQHTNQNTVFSALLNQTKMWNLFGLKNKKINKSPLVAFYEMCGVIWTGSSSALCIFGLKSKGLCNKFDVEDILKFAFWNNLGPVA